jgi:hypothetical protein
VTFKSRRLSLHIQGVIALVHAPICLLTPEESVDIYRSFFLLEGLHLVKHNADAGTDGFQNIQNTQKIPRKPREDLASAVYWTLGNVLAAPAETGCGIYNALRHEVLARDGGDAKVAAP